MVNPNNLQLLSDSLEDILETIVSVKLLGLLTLEQRTKICWLIGQWSQGSRAIEKEPVEKIKEILNSAKEKLPKRRFNSTGQYNKLNQ